ncbi:MAG: hypothetical protein HYY45_19330 [Deltaproteobacteria bacterium]|nr:hypothetical protein [Deltaproteobacteria bacterium]
MKLTRPVFTALFLLLLLLPCGAGAQDFKKWEAQLSEYRQWLDVVGLTGSRFWLRLDSSRRPHKVYVGEGFDKAAYELKEQFVEIFSHYLAGHPEKFALIDLFDAATGAAIGEFGWGGFRLYPNYRWLAQESARND